MVLQWIGSLLAYLLYCIGQKLNYHESLEDMHLWHYYAEECQEVVYPVTLLAIYTRMLAIYLRS